MRILQDVHWRSNKRSGEGRALKRRVSKRVVTQRDQSSHIYPRQAGIKIQRNRFAFGKEKNSGYF